MLASERSDRKYVIVIMELENGEKMQYELESSRSIGLNYTFHSFLRTVFRDGKIVVTENDNTNVPTIGTRIMPVVQTVSRLRFLSSA
jgi:hypothetical protein